jgi:hypothetical protein
MPYIIGLFVVLFWAFVIKFALVATVHTLRGKESAIRFDAAISRATNTVARWLATATVLGFLCGAAYLAFLYVDSLPPVTPYSHTTQSTPVR